MNKRGTARAAHIEGIVVASEELQLRGEVAQRARHEAEQDGSRCSKDRE